MQCLVPGGRWAVQTDHAEYFEIIRGVLLSHSGLKEVPFDDPDAGVIDDGVATNFEIKYRREGRAIYQIAMQRRRRQAERDAYGLAFGSADV